jgi:hypothetical protein
LQELLAETGELDRILDGRGLTFESVPAPAVEPPAPFVIEPPDWYEELRAREQAVELEPEPEPDVPTYPAKKQTKTPRLDRAKQILAELKANR